MAAATAGRSPADDRPDAPPGARFRYGAVFVLTLSLCVFLIVAPDSDWAHAVALAFLCAALLVVVATSRASPAVRHARALAGACATVAILIAVAVGALPLWVVFALAALLSLAIPIALAGGLLRLIRARGVTLQAVAGALTIYVVLGLVFSWVIGVVAYFGAAPFFTDGSDGTGSDRLYFSFTALTTTGFGDLAAATGPGRAVVLIEMLTGQLYLVTVIGVLVGSFGRR